MKILIADRNAKSRQMISSAVIALGHDVVIFTGQLEAIEAPGAKGEAQIAFVDHAVPGANCPGVLRDIRKRYGPNIYIILLTEPNSAKAMTRELEAAVDDLLLRPFTEAELRTHIRTGARLLELQRGHFETQRLLLNAAMCDDLTGLWNRRMILNQLARELNRTRHEQQSMAVAMVDIDWFKGVNDTFGHVAGDSVLRDVAAALRSQLRSYDFIGRYGGEEFLSLLPGCDTETAVDIARRMCQTVASHRVHFGEIEIPVTVSIGVSSTADVGFDMAALIVAADEELYRAKDAGRNQVVARKACNFGARNSYAIIP